MNTLQISQAMRRCIGFLGVYPRDKLKNLTIVQRPAAFIINTDKSDKPGKHWVAVYVDANGRVEYFDSYGQAPLREVISKFKKLHISRVLTSAVQAAGSVVCGQYCIFFCHMRLERKLSLSNILKILRRFNSFVTDNMVNEYIRKHFRIEANAYDQKVINQICTAY